MGTSVFFFFYYLFPFKRSDITIINFMFNPAIIKKHFVLLLKSVGQRQIWGSEWLLFICWGCCVDLFGLSWASVCIAIMVKSNHTMSHPAVTPSFYVSIAFLLSFLMLLHLFSIFKIFSFPSVFLSSQKAKADPSLPHLRPSSSSAPQFKP